MRVWEKKEGQPVTCTLDKDNKSIKIEGILGECEQVFKGEDILFANNRVLIKSKSSYGYFVSRMKGLLQGVSNGYYVELTVVGRGYRFINLVDTLLVKLGYTHYLKYNAPKGIKIFGSRTNLLIFGLDLEQVNSVAALIRNFMEPESYKGKGIRYAGEEVILKVGKKS